MSVYISKTFIYKSKKKEKKKLSVVAFSVRFIVERKHKNIKKGKNKKKELKSRGRRCQANIF